MYTIAIIVSYAYNAKFPGILLSNDSKALFWRKKKSSITLLGHLNAKQNAAAIKFNLW